MRKTLTQALLAAFYAILLAAHLEGGGVMSIAGRNAMLAGGGGWKNPYVTNGLIAMWDGEWNAGGGIHDPNATVWKDLVDGVELSKYGAPTINADSYSFDGSSAMYKSLSLGEVDHLEIVLAIHEGNVTSGDPEFLRLNGSFQQKCFTRNGVYPGIEFGVTNKGGISAVSPSMGVIGKRWSLAWTSSTTPQKSYRNGVQAATWNTTAVQANTSYIAIGAGGTLYRPSKCEVVVVRLYNRALTAAEVAANYAVDKARFNLP